MGGAAVLFLCLLVSSFRHYGGDQEVGDGGTAYACEAWWYELGTPQGATDGDHLPSHHCREAAINATGPAVGESLGAGALVGTGSFGLLTVRRRRFHRELSALAADGTAQA